MQVIVTKMLEVRRDCSPLFSCPETKAYEAPFWRLKFAFGRVCSFRLACNGYPSNQDGYRKISGWIHHFVDPIPQKAFARRLCGCREGKVGNGRSLVRLKRSSRQLELCPRKPPRIKAQTASLLLWVPSVMTWPHMQRKVLKDKRKKIYPCSWPFLFDTVFSITQKEDHDFTPMTK